MKKNIALLLSLTLGLTAVCAIPTSETRAESSKELIVLETPTDSGSDETEAAETASVTMFRLYNPNSGEHFYTKDKSEKAGLVKEGWNDEGTGWIAPVTSDTPVYRLYNANAGDHHYTLQEAEKNNLISAGWNYEGIGWYSDDAETVPLYREYNPNAVTGTHNYTKDKAEHDGLVTAGWHDEGIGWYGILDNDTLKLLDSLPILPNKIENGYNITLNPGAEYGAYLYDWNYAKLNYLDSYGTNYLKRDEEQLKINDGKAYSELFTDFNTYPDCHGLDGDEYLSPGEVGRFVLLRWFEFKDSNKTLFKDGGITGWAVCYVDVVNDSNKKAAKVDCPILRILFEV